MVDKNDTERSPTSIERARKKQLAQEEGSRMMAQFQQEAVAVRKNMERLRALRLAKESEAEAQADSEPAAPKKKARKKA
ncbi:transcriptional regulator [Rhodopseudomonas palustris]|uniref:Transcriptional regulator n=1 Tax=Rhodopseudomonas palustris TaxID=1076 RepID=A0A418UZ22_RHOPL|nr:transcriptional regulator [Rhodopseudomonas palustris]RJF68616.1 transcriptional regulator [Rhodopseudomonas palustris]